MKNRKLIGLPCLFLAIAFSVSLNADELSQEELNGILERLSIERGVSRKAALELLEGAIERARDDSSSLIGEDDEENFKNFVIFNSRVADEIKALSDELGEPVKKSAEIYLKNKKKTPLTVKQLEAYELAVENFVAETSSGGDTSPKVAIKIGESSTPKGLKKKGKLNFANNNSSTDWHLKAGVVFLWEEKPFQFGGSDVGDTEEGQLYIPLEYSPYLGFSGDVSDNDEITSDVLKASVGMLIHRQKVLDLSLNHESNRRFTKKNVLASGVFWFGDELEFLSKGLGKRNFLDFGIGYESGSVVSDELPNDIERGGFSRASVHLEYIYFPNTGIKEIDENLSFSLTNTLRFLSDDDWNSYNYLDTSLDYKLSEITSLNLTYANGKEPPEFKPMDKVEFGIGFKK